MSRAALSRLRTPSCKIFQRDRHVHVPHEPNVHLRAEGLDVCRARRRPAAVWRGRSVCTFVRPCARPQAAPPWSVSQHQRAAYRAVTQDIVEQVLGHVRRVRLIALNVHCLQNGYLPSEEGRARGMVECGFGGAGGGREPVRTLGVMSIRGHARTVPPGRPSPPSHRIPHLLWPWPVPAHQSRAGAAAAAPASAIPGRDPCGRAAHRLREKRYWVAVAESADVVGGPPGGGGGSVHACGQPGSWSCTAAPMSDMYLSRRPLCVTASHVALRKGALGRNATYKTLAARASDVLRACRQRFPGFAGAVTARTLVNRCCSAARYTFSTAASRRSPTVRYRVDGRTKSRPSVVLYQYRRLRTRARWAASVERPALGTTRVRVRRIRTRSLRRLQTQAPAASCALETPGGSQPATEGARTPRLGV